MIEEAAIHTANSKRMGVVKFLRFLDHLKEEGLYQQFFKMLKENPRAVSPATWELIQGDYWQQLENRKDILGITKNTSISPVRQLLSNLAREGVIPHLSWLAHFPRGRKSDWTANLTFAAAGLLRDRLVHRQVDCARDEAENTLDLYESLSRNGFPSEAPEHIPDLVLALINHRLSLIRNIFEKVILEGIEKLEFGEKCIAECNLSPESIDAIFKDSAGLKRRPSKLFSNNSIGLGRLLVYVQWKWGHIPGGDDDTFASYFRKMSNQLTYGSQAVVDAYINPPVAMLAAVAGLLIIDTAANPYPIYELSRAGCLETDTAYPDYRWVTWYKRRGGGRLLRKLLPEIDKRYQVSAVKALATILKYTECLVRHSTPEDGGYVFISGRNFMLDSDVTITDRIGPLQDHRFQDHIGRMLEGAPELRGASITPKTLRSYILLKTALETRSIFAVQEVGQHISIRTSWGYVYKLPTHIQHEALIREFLSNLEVLLTHDKPGFLKKAGVDAKEFQQRLSSLSRTGLGLDCLDIRSGIQPGTVSGEICHRIDKCLECKNAKRQIQADLQTLSDIILWKRQLDNERPQLLRENPERWESVWLPWQVFCEVVLDKVQSRTILRRVRKQAEKIANESTRSFPPLW